LVTKPSEITESQIIQEKYYQQNVTQWESAAQTQYVADLRAGNVGLATALLQPKSENTFYGNDTRNTETFLQERGYDISKPETIPDSVFSPKKSEGRNVIGLETMGNLERFEYQKDRNPDKSLIQFATSEVQQRRAEAATRYEKIKNPIFLPSEYNSNEKLIGTGSYETVSPTIFPTVSSTQPLTRGELRYSATPTSQDPYDAWYRYSDKVDAGLVAHPRDTPSLLDDFQYYFSTGVRPIYNPLFEVSNLARDDPIPIQPTTAGLAIGGLIEAGEFALTGGKSGSPLEHTMPKVWDYISEDPIRFLSELPAEVAMALTGGKAIQLGAKGLTATKGAILASGKTPNVISGAIKAGDKLKTKIDMLNPITRKNYKATEKIADKIYPPEIPRRIESFGRNTFLITSGTESVTHQVPAIVVKFGRKGQTVYYAESPNEVLTGKSIIIHGKIPPELKKISQGKTFAEYQEGAKGGLVGVKGKKFDYTIPMTPYNMSVLGTKEARKVIEPVGLRIKEPTKIAVKSEEHFYWRKPQQDILAETKTPEWKNPWPKIEKTKYVKEDTPVLNKTFYKKKPLDEPKKLEPPKSTQPITKVEISPITKPANIKLKEIARQTVKSETGTGSYIIGSVVVGLATKSAYSTSLKTGVTQKLETRTKLESSTIPRVPTKLKTKTGLKSSTMPRLKTTTQLAAVVSPIVPMITVTRRIPPLIWYPTIEMEQKKKRKRVWQKSKDFRGNVRLDNIMGVYGKRSTITYSRKKITKYATIDSRITKKTKNRIENTTELLGKIKKKRKSKTETYLGYTWKKTMKKSLF